jgi:methylenetetrahydrofolate dehydrogenase (NADP+)/methenyltetrahydrofolate cyclohydrolase
MVKCRTQVVDGDKIAERIKDGIVKEVLGFNQGKFQNAEIRPNLAILLIGDNPESELYVGKKTEEAKKVGIDTHLYKFDEEDSEEDILKAIEILNQDSEIDGILVQLPLPKKFNTDKIIKAINYRKDVDCFHPDNQGKAQNKIISPVYGAVMEILKEVDFDVKDKKVLIISNSEIFGKNLEKILNNRKAEVKTVLSNNPGLKKEISKADLLITATGKPHFIKKEMLKDGAGVIDIGISRKGKKLKGDVDPYHLGEKACFYTPVPGGIGPMTVAFLLKNTLELFKIKRDKL